MNKVEMISF